MSLKTFPFTLAWALTLHPDKEATTNFRALALPFKPGPSAGATRNHQHTIAHHNTLSHMKTSAIASCTAKLIKTLALLATLGAIVGAEGNFFDRIFLDHEVLPHLDQMRGFAIQATPTETSQTVTVPSAPTTFDAAICSAYPEICVNAGLLPVPTGAS